MSSARGIYHGATNGNGPWPNTAAAYVPSVSLLSRSIYLHAARFMPNADHGQDNPPFLNNAASFPVGTPAWFAHSMAFPQPVTGGSWAQCTWAFPTNGDTAVVPEYQIMWYHLNDTQSGRVCGWQIHATCHVDGTIFAGGGPGTAMSDQSLAYVGGVPRMQITGTTAVPVTGPALLVAGGLINVNVYRGAPSFGAEYQGLCHLLGVECRYRVVA